MGNERPVADFERGPAFDWRDTLTLNAGHDGNRR
jgi:hypothetical protein